MRRAHGAHVALSPAPAEPRGDAPRRPRQPLACALTSRQSHFKVSQKSEVSSNLSGFECDSVKGLLAPDACILCDVPLAELP